MARSVLRRIRVASKDELSERIKHYIEICNKAPLVPKWSYWRARAGGNRHSRPIIIAT